MLPLQGLRRKLLKTTYTEERCVHINSESCNDQFNFKQIIQISQQGKTTSDNYLSRKMIKGAKLMNVDKGR